MTSEDIRAAFQIGFASARANLMPMVSLWALAVILVSVYYLHPGFACALEPLREWQGRSGWIGPFLNRVAFCGVLPGVFLSPLFFRLVKRGRPLPFAPVPPEKLIAVGEGREGYFCYLGGDRVALYSFGLDVLSGHPEAVSLLDGMIDYCLSAGEK